VRRVKVDPDQRERWDDYLSDSSSLAGNVDEIIFCHNSDDVKQIIKESLRFKKDLTIQGAMTGICGGAVPEKGYALNLSEMNSITGMTYSKTTGDFFIKVQPGLTLDDLNKVILSGNIDTHQWDSPDKAVYEFFKKAPQKFFPPDPTETLATLGGMAACDASGACSLKYGSMRNYIEGLRIITGNSEELHIRRGQYKYSDLNKLIVNDLSPLPEWHDHDHRLKDVAGLYCKDEMDLIELFIGSEGLLGVITELELRLPDAPPLKSGIMLFLTEDHRVADFVEWLRSEVQPAAIEYFDKEAFSLLNSLRNQKREIAALPEIQQGHRGGFYLEFHSANEESLNEILLILFDNLAEYGLNQEVQWLALDYGDFEKLKEFRHVLPECINALVVERNRDNREIMKVGTDMAVPDGYLNDVLQLYQHREDILDTTKIVFGHIGNNHLHVNLISGNPEGYKQSIHIVESWAEKVIEWGGTVTAEHGIGRLKKNLLKLMMDRSDIDSMRKIINIFNPCRLINDGVLIDQGPLGGIDGV